MWTCTLCLHNRRHDSPVAVSACVVALSLVLLEAYCKGDTRRSNSGRHGTLVLELAWIAGCMSVRLVIFSVPSESDVTVLRKRNWPPEDTRCNADELIGIRTGKI